MIVRVKPLQLHFMTRVLLLLCHVITIVYSLAGTAVDTIRNKKDSIKFRPGLPSDESLISFTMSRNLMNPLNIDYKRFLVAMDTNREGEGLLVGWVQIRPLGSGSTSLLWEPNKYDSSPRSVNADSISRQEI